MLPRSRLARAFRGPLNTFRPSNTVADAHHATRHVSPPNDRQFCQIAVNSRYICYGLRAGQIRVLHKDTSERALLRGHTQMIGDMRFAPSSKDDIIASFGVDGNLLVKRIKFAEDAIEEQPLLQVTVVNPPAGSVPRVRWLSKSRLAASIGDAIFGVDVDLKAREPVVFTAELTEVGMPEGAPNRFIVFAPLGQKPSIDDFDFSPEGSLACAHADGTVRVYSAPTGEGDVIDFAYDGPPSVDATFEPFAEDPDGALASIAWVGDDAIVVGGESNKTLALWKLGSGDMEGAECVQTLKVSGDVYNFSCVAYPHARLVLLANLRKQSVYAVHLAAEAAGFDYVSEFSVTMPILSFTALKESDDPYALQLYCMQTQAIQQYALHIDRCRPEGSQGDEGEYVINEEEADADTDGFESAAEEDETVAVPAITPATPTPTTPAASAPGSSKLLTPGELMSMASGGSAAASGAGSAPESPRAAEGSAGSKPPPPKPKAPGPAPAGVNPLPPPPLPPPPPSHHRGPPPPGHPHGPPPPGHLEQSLAMLRQQIGQDLSGFVTAMQAEREAAERERQKQLLTAVSAAITRDLPVQMEKIVTNIVKRELKALAPALAADIAKAKSGGGDASSSKEIVKALPGALATAMTGTVVPKFEAATREMFEQVKGAFEKGMDDIAQELYTQKENAIAAEATPLISSLRLASSEVRGAAEALLTMESIPNGGGSKTGPGAKTVQATSLEELEATMDPTIELGRLVDEGKYEEAFQKALGMSSVDTVTWTCGRCEPVRDEIFGAVPVPLSQTVLLSLMQQLSSDLDDEPSLKLQWIQAACLAMDPSDQSLAQALPVILGAVFDSLTETAQAPDTPAGVRGDLRLVLHVVNSLLSSFPK